MIHPPTGDTALQQFINNAPMVKFVGETIKNAADAIGDNLVKMIAGPLDKLTAAARNMEAKSLIPSLGGGELSGGLPSSSPSLSAGVSPSVSGPAIQKSIGIEKSPNLDRAMASANISKGIEVSEASEKNLGEFSPMASPTVGIQVAQGQGAAR